MNEIVNKAVSFKYGGMSCEELEYLYNFCKDKDVLELGSMVGMSSFVIASVCNVLHCVDVWKDTQEHLEHDKVQQEVYQSFLKDLPNMLEKFSENCAQFIKSKKIIMHIGTTQDKVDDFSDKSIDILLIDADHSYKGVSNDFFSYYNKVKDGGYFLFHDYGGAEWPGVKNYVMNPMIK